ncbi:hypothetical protein Elgi_12180 [Paenibacillus elgii]|nr:hypothetical protein Elgi_12180 [Paenibacillus elgii]
MKAKLLPDRIILRLVLRATDGPMIDFGSFRGRVTARKIGTEGGHTENPGRSAEVL